MTGRGDALPPGMVKFFERFLFEIPAHTEVQLATNGVCPDQVFDLRASTGRIERLILSFWSPTPPSR